ncbi:hypothetical protein [uncultured Duncaniella sp.]|uniref:hypothetical protein n=1 Tax=uncultured Duncaniella sp. TaxID=2768039 RepID=UPI002659B4C8|nr:hypothetical protein [uncultured Duncaniella sp.]
MKKSNIIIRNSIAVGAILALSACTQEEIFEPSINGIPQASDYQIGVSVDDLNNVELNILDKNGATATGVYPIWYVNGSQRPSTALTYRDLITIAGDYPVEMKVGNANGVSDGTVTGTIHVDKTIFDFTPYMRGLTDNSSKEWAVDGTKQGHMACGEGPDNPSGWWNGEPGCKEAEGVYDNILTFAYTDSETSGSYNFNPGSAGTFYANTGIHSLPGYEVNNPGNGQDFRVNATEMVTTFALVPEGANLYLTLPPHTPFPYVPSEAAFANPKYRIVNFSKSEITLVQDLEGISWQYIIAPKAEDTTFKGFKYDSEFNLWKTANVTLQSTWFSGSDWNGGLEPAVCEVTNDKITVKTPSEMGNDQWKGQVHVGTDIQLSAGETYDFSCFIDCPTDAKVTVKVQKDGDDGVSLNGDKQIEFKADGSCYYFTDLPGFDGTLKIAFDFAGYPDTEFVISNIVIKKHSDDDGTVIPTEPDEPEKPVTWVDVNSADNLFKGCTFTTEFFYAPNWAQIADPKMTEDGNSWTLDLPEATSDQWQAQFKMHTDIATSADKRYDFRVTFYSTKPLPGVTFKCVLNGDDNVFYMADRVEVPEYDDVTYKWVDIPGIDMSKMSIVFDFGGNPADTKVTVKDIIVQEHRD